ncbi:DUF4215 domain-containing protein [Candidatus Woesearchaeota archaeon]|nr:DUF4215 domain-containing protein [Candidatus Woesearchaeota archaeon]
MPGSSDVCRMGPLYGDTQCTCCGDGIIQWNTCGPEPDCIEFIEQCEQDSDCPDDLDGKTLEGCENCVCKYKTNPQCDPDDAMVFDPQPEKDIPFEIKVTSDLPYGWVVVTVNGVNLGGPLSVDNIGGRWQWTWQYTATSYGTYDVRFYMNAEYDNPEVGIECANREFTISEEQPYCGDDFINQPSETCDDTDFTDGIDYGDTVCWIKVQDYAQSTYCRMVGEKPCTCCGDSIIQTAYGEKCDDGNTVDEPNSDLNQCRNDCTFCGDGTLDAGEECDDGNKIDGDGCALDCTTENDIPEFSFITGALAAISVLILLFIKRKR